jgi:Zn-dependent metalloprotease/subtilisin family serine protease
MKTVALLTLVAVPVFAEEAAPRAHRASPALHDGRKAPPPAEPTADQQEAGRKAREAGLRLEWGGAQAVPLSVRGHDLGQRAHFSGGHGLNPKGGGRHAEDAVAVLDNLARIYRIRDAQQEFSARTVQEDKLGFHHARMEQRYQGVRVVGGELIVHYDRSNTAYEVNGRYVPDVTVDTHAKISPEAAAQTAQADLEARGCPAGALAAGPELVVFAKACAPTLAYELTLAYDDTGKGPGRWRYWIDAQAGTVILAYNNIQYLAAPTTNGASAMITGNILTREGGQAVALPGWYENAGYYYLYSCTNHWSVFNSRPVNTGVYPDDNSYAWRATPDWGASDRVEMSVAHALDWTQKYYREVHGRQSYDSSNAIARAYVHYNVAYVNAFWDGADFYIGDGDGVMADPLGVQDIVGHEFTHAVTQYTADLYYMNESGALNESFSDIFGTCVEFFAQADGRAAYPLNPPGTADWLCGEDSWKSSIALRDLRGPAYPGTVGIGNEQPTRYQGSFWYSGTDDNGGVHQNSGVQNHFFHLLCEGGQGTNDGIVYNLTGIGITNAEKIAYRALTVYCGPNTDHAAARCAWMSAAQDLNPGWATNVDAAWTAVGVNPLVISTTQLFPYRGPLGGPFAPRYQTVTLVNTGFLDLAWSASSSQAWIRLSATSGILSARTSTNVTVTIDDVANSYSRALYAGAIAFGCDLSPSRQVCLVKLYAGIPDILNEWGAGDMNYQCLTFIPDGTPNGYTVDRQPATNFPSDPAGGSTLTIADNSFATVSLSGGAKVPVFGVPYTRFYVGIHGFVTCKAGDNMESSGGFGSVSYEFYNQTYGPRIAFASTLLSLARGGSVSCRQWTNRVVVTFQDVQDKWGRFTNNCQTEMFFDGTIRVTFLNGYMSRVGLGRGEGQPWAEAAYGVSGSYSDFSRYGRADSLQVTPYPGFLEFTASGAYGGPFTFTNRVYTLSNTGAQALNWAAVHTQAWLSLSATNGTLAAGASTNVTVSLSSEAYATPGGSYTDAVRFRNVDTYYEKWRPATLMVSNEIPGTIAVLDSVAPAADTNLPFGSVLVGLSDRQHVTITNSSPNRGLTLTSIGTCLYAEDFNDGLAQGWVQNGAWVVTNGAFRPPEGSSTPWFGAGYFPGVWSNDVSMSVRHWVTGDENHFTRFYFKAAPSMLCAIFEFGVPGENAYFLDFDPMPIDGSMGGPRFRTGRVVDGTYTFFDVYGAEPGSYYGAWRNTATNTIRFETHGPLVQFYLDDMLLVSKEDPDAAGTGTYIAGGGLSIAAWNKSSSTPWFDEVTVNDGQVGSGGGVSTCGRFRVENIPALPYRIPPAGSLTLDAVYAPLAAVSNACRLRIVCNDTNRPVVEVPLSGVGSLDYLRVSPAADWSPEGHVGGPFAPSNQIYTLTNAGAVEIAWSVSAGATWATVSPASGTLPPGGQSSVVAQLTGDTGGLGAGTYTNVLTFRDETTTLTQTRSAVLRVLACPIIQVSPATITVTNLPGQRTQRLLTVGNAAAAEADLQFSLSTHDGIYGILNGWGGADGLGLLGGDSGGGAAVAGLGVSAVPGSAGPCGLQLTLTNAAPVVPAAPEHRPGRLLVRFADNVGGAERASLLAAGGATLRREFRLVKGLCAVSVPDEVSMTNAMRIWKGLAGVKYAEPDYRVHALAVPSDPRFGELWGMRNTGQSNGVVGADIGATAAWDVQTGSRDVIVAVIDTGIDYNHEDLRANLWANPREIPGNGIDDDGNGYIDDVYGMNAIRGSGNPMDDNDHGTHCAGTIGAAANNGVGVAGVCWNVRLMACKFLDENGSGYTEDAIACVEYAVENGARVLNNSWGGGGYMQAMRDVIDAAGVAGVTFVAAAGNYGIGYDTDIYPNYPSCYDCSNIVSVMATDWYDSRTYFSLYGRNTVDLAAPGLSILSCRRSGGYMTMSGTSMATPHVAGACALLLSQDPTLTVDELRQALFRTVDCPEPPNSLVCATGGRMNVARALASLRSRWLTAAPTSAEGIAPAMSTNLTVTFDAGTLKPGTYTGTVVIASNDQATPVTNIVVVMVVLADGLAVSPEYKAEFRGSEGGPFWPASSIFVVTNNSASAMGWSVSCSSNWLNALPAGGTLAAHASQAVTVRMLEAGNTLPQGAYEASLLFSNTLTGATAARGVKLAVEPRAETTIHEFPLDSDPGWTCEGAWAFGAPQGYGGDPATPFSGLNVYGYNLAGPYSNSMPVAYLTTGALDLGGYTNVVLRFQRWLVVDAPDAACLQVSTDGVNWSNLWSNAGTLIQDTSWQSVSYALPAFAQGQPAVYLRWGMGPTDASFAYAGWNLDDVSLTGQTVDSLLISPRDGLSARGRVGGAVFNSSRSYRLANVSDAPMSWSAGASQAWLSVTPASGVLAPGATTTVLVAVNSQAQALTNGTWHGTVAFTNGATGRVHARFAALKLKPGPVAPDTPYPAHGQTRVVVETALQWNYPTNGLFTPGGSNAAPDVLLYTDDIIRNPGNMQAELALQALGVPYVACYNGDLARFESLLSDGGPWRIVIFANDYFRMPSTTFDTLLDHVSGGGKLIAHSWMADQGHVLWGAMGVGASTAVYSPVPIYWWDASHRIATSPERVPAVLDAANCVNYGSFGQSVQPINGGVAIAGYTTDITSDGAALIVGRGGQTIFRGFIDAVLETADVDADGKLDGVELWENLIASMAGETTFDVYLSTSTPPTNRIGAGLTSLSRLPQSSLRFNTQYYWQVVASNDVGVSTSAVWSFTTLPPPVLRMGPAGFGSTLLATNSWADFTLAITNSGEAALAWQANVPGTWMTCTPSNGTLAAPGTSNLTVRVRSAGLKPGDTRSGSLLFVNNDPASPTQTVSASLQVGCTFDVATPQGSVHPAVGRHLYPYGAAVTCAVTSLPIPLGQGTQVACIGWTATGNAPLAGAGTNATLTLTNNAALTWNWTNQVWLALATSGSGTLSRSSQWLIAGTNIGVQATPATYHHLTAWSGDTSGCAVAGNVLTAAMTRARAIQVGFAADLAAHGTPLWWLAQHVLTNAAWDAEELLDRDADGMTAQAEYVADTIPTNTQSVLALLGVTNTSNGVWLFWKGGSSATQYIECADSLLGTPVWTAIATQAPPTLVTNAAQDLSAPGSNRFYRLRVMR